MEREYAARDKGIRVAEYTRSINFCYIMRKYFKTESNSMCNATIFLKSVESFYVDPAGDGDPIFYQHLFLIL